MYILWVWYFWRIIEEGGAQEFFVTGELYSYNWGVCRRGSKHCFSLLYSGSLSFIMFIFLLTPFATRDWGDIVKKKIKSGEFGKKDKGSCLEKWGEGGVQTFCTLWCSKLFKDLLVTVVLFYLLFGCPTANWRSLLMGQPCSSNINHCVLPIFDQKVTGSLEVGFISLT